MKLDNMPGRDPPFSFLRYPLMASKAPMIHWAQAVTYKALSSLLLKL